MGQNTVTSNLFYDLVSIQYHALKGQEVYGRFLQDAQGQQEIAQFIEQVRTQDVQRAEQCHRFLAQLSGTEAGGRGEPYPMEQGVTGQATGKQAKATART